jgi:hypothetical protein
VLDLRARISPHFGWWEVVHTQHRDPALVAAQLDPSEFIQRNARRLAWGLAEHVHDDIGIMGVSSWYRCGLLNVAVGGSGTKPGQKPSAHLEARAMDFHPRDMGLVEAYEYIAGKGYEALDKIILECLGGGAWIHMHVAREGVQPRHATLMTFDGDRYPLFDPSDERVIALREVVR